MPKMTRAEKIARLNAFEASLPARAFRDTEAKLHADLVRAEKFESDDWHLSDDARACLVNRSKAFGNDLGSGDMTDQYVNLF